MKNLFSSGILVLAAGSLLMASAAQVHGVLVSKADRDKVELRVGSAPRMIEGGMLSAEALTRQQELKSECQKAGYGVYTADNKFLTFDEAGNRKAVAALKLSKKEDDLEVDVTGEVQGDTIKVVTVKIK